MRSYYFYTHDVDGAFVRGNVAVATFEGIGAEELAECLLEAARVRIKAMGYTIPKRATLRFVPDDRNVEDAAGYPPVREPSPRASDSYAVASEYEAGITPRH